MNTGYWPCLGVNTGRQSSAVGCIVVLGRGVSAMNTPNRIDLSDAEHAQLTTLLNGGKHAAQNRAVSDEAIAGNVSVGSATAHRTKRHFLPGSPESAPSEEARVGADARCPVSRRGPSTPWRRRSEAVAAGTCGACRRWTATMSHVWTALWMQENK
jgi:hypothetical protein